MGCGGDEEEGGDGLEGDDGEGERVLVIYGFFFFWRVTSLSVWSGLSCIEEL